MNNFDAEQEIIQHSFELLGKVLHEENCKQIVTQQIEDIYGINTDISTEIVEMAFEQWAEVYYLE